MICCCTQCYNTDQVEEVGWAVHTARTVERVDNDKSEKIKIFTRGNLLENCSMSLFPELFPRVMVDMCTVYCWNKER